MQTCLTSSICNAFETTYKSCIKSYWSRLIITRTLFQNEFRADLSSFDEVHTQLEHRKTTSLFWDYHHILNTNSCIDIYSYSCLHPLSNERKSMFKSGDSRAVWTWVWTWKYLKWALHYLHDVIYGTHCGPDWSFCRCFCSRNRCVRLWRNDVRKYTADAILFREIQCKKMDNLMFKQRFQCELSWNKVKYARVTITHVCFIALTLAGSLGWCWTLGLSASCSKSILGARQMLMHEKTCVIPILKHYKNVLKQTCLTSLICNAFGVTDTSCIKRLHHI